MAQGEVLGRIVRWSWVLSVARETLECVQFCNCLLDKNVEQGDDVVGP